MPGGDPDSHEVEVGSADVRILSITVDVALTDAYTFAWQPENFPKWAAGLSTSLRQTAEGWVADTPSGKALIEFSEPNAYGVLDHTVKVKGKPDVHVPLRMIENGDGTEVELVLFRQPGMSDADFEHDAASVRHDLMALKNLLEAQFQKP